MKNENMEPFIRKSLRSSESANRTLNQELVLSWDPVLPCRLCTDEAGLAFSQNVPELMVITMISTVIFMSSLFVL